MVFEEIELTMISISSLKPIFYPSAFFHTQMILLEVLTSRNRVAFRVLCGSFSSLGILFL